MQLTSVLTVSGLVSLACAAYTIEDDYSGSNFFNLMSFDTENDPTHGYVNYVNQDTARSSGLASSDNGVVTLRADSTNVASGRGRNSVRVTSTKQYTHGLVVLDLQHMPGNACGIWPAFWMTGPGWPNNGEIDIIEGISYQNQNSMTLHTSSGCSFTNKNCEGVQGCGVEVGGPASYGDGFNNANGGVYAMEWTSNAINIWFFTRNNVPSGISGDSPDPSSWGAPTASFQGGSSCSIDNQFKNHNIIFDTTFCGDWAGNVWGQDSTCSSKAATCQDYVANNPSAFSSAYWAINSLKVYSQSSSDNGHSEAQSASAAAPAPTTLVQSVIAALASAAAPSPSSQSGGGASIAVSSGAGSAAPGKPVQDPHQLVGVGSTSPNGMLNENPLAERAAAAAAAAAGKKRDIDANSRSFHRRHLADVLASGERLANRRSRRSIRHSRHGHLPTAGK